MSNQVIVLLLGGFDPPTNDVRHACTSLLNRPEVKSVWLCPIDPISPAKHVVDLCNVFCQQYYLETNNKITCCTAAIDKNMSKDQLVEWARINYPNEDFRLADFSPFFTDRKPVYRIFFAGEGISSGRDVAVKITQAFSVSKNITSRIKSGRDESRNMFRVVWEYIQKHKLYRS